MNSFDSIRVTAFELHESVVAHGANAMRPLELARAGVDKKELILETVPPGHHSLNGARALFDEQSSLIVCEDAPSDVEKAELIAHELGHACNHTGASSCSSNDIDSSRSIEASPVGMVRVEDYGVRERRELQANVFAREFLLPRSVALKLYVEDGLTAEEVARRTGLGINLVRQQICDALLLPPLRREPPANAASPGSSRTKDKSQEGAAAHRGSPFQLQAGPGTGKTRTLVDRIASLICEGQPADSILVLTFSNRAAGELLDRLAKELPDEAPKVWAGTFHAFGLDLVRRYHDRLGRSAKPRLFDRSDTIEAMEELFPTLPLIHHRSIWNPTTVLCDVLNAVSRAKDEMVDPDKYCELAEAMRANAKDDEEARTTAEKCLEVGTVYRRYQALLDERDAVDFGDLVMKPTLLLESDASLRTALQLRHRHILVDEYQDVNYASARFLKALAGDGGNLWVVGDARQAIYRFRGASPSNMAAFSKEYPNAKIHQLEINYRSCQEIVDVFQSISPHMGSSEGMLALQLSARMGTTGVKPAVLAYGNAEEELDGIAANIAEQNSRGIKFKDQAVLCHTNDRLERVAVALSARGIPCLHLGCIFERSEVRDLLAILSVVVDPYCDALTRVGAMPRYNLSLQDVFEATKAIRAIGLPALEGIRKLPSTKISLSRTGKAGIQRLLKDLEVAETNSSAWELLATYLLDRTDLGKQLAFGNSAASQVAAIAVWQLLNFVREQRASASGLPILQVLQRIRQLVLLEEDRDLRRVPECASEIDAVRVMTIHGSKGLEFDSVHLPGLNDQSFPARLQWKRCHPPTGLIAERAGVASVDEATGKRHEEECLFFVALSRAKKSLRIYLSKQVGGKTRKPSEFLSWIPSSRTTSVSPLPQYPNPPATDADSDVIQILRKSSYAITDGRLRAFQRCPRRFFYTHVLELGGARKTSAFVRTQNCFFEFMRVLAEVRHKGTLSLGELEELFEATWREKGPTDSGYVSDYRALSSKLIASLHRSSTGLTFIKANPIEVKLSNGVIVVEPSEVANTVDGSFVIRRVKTGTKKSDEVDKDLVWTVYIMAAERAFKKPVTVQAVHLNGDTVEAVTLTARKLSTRIERTETLLGQINGGHFPAAPTEGECAECPHYFICDAVSAGTLQI